MVNHEYRFKPYTRNSIKDAPQWQFLTSVQQEAVLAVSRVLPFRVNAYVLDELIDWSNIPDDPIFRLTFPHRDMLQPVEYESLCNIESGRSSGNTSELIKHIRLNMNPHPAGQLTHNVPHKRLPT